MDKIAIFGAIKGDRAWVAFRTWRHLDVSLSPKLLRPEPEYMGSPMDNKEPQAMTINEFIVHEKKRARPSYFPPFMIFI